jgi:predicted O-linked N-acetylglucosamine transferase (SPINDLY family)
MNAKQQAADQFAAAVQHHRAGRLIDAERCYRQACVLEPGDAGQFHRLGVLAHQLGRNDATDLLRRAIELRPDFAEAHNDLGVIFGATGKFVEAIACFDDAIANKPDYHEAHNNRGNALTRLGRADEAIASHKKALALRPNDSPTYMYIGNVLEAQGRSVEAAEQYAKALAIAPRSVLAHYNLAAALKRQGKLTEAASHYRQAIAIAPTFAEAHNNLGLILHELGRLDDALVHCERAVALKPNFAAAHNNLGNVLREKGRPAAAQYERAIALDPNFVMAHYNLGLAQRSQSRFADASVSLERALALDPDCLEARFALCMAQLPILYASEDEIEKQRAAYERSLIDLRGEVARLGAFSRFADVVGSQQPFYLAYQGQNDKDLQAVYGALVGASMQARYPSAPLPSPPRSGEPLTIGIVSGFFRHHSNWRIPIKGWLGQLDRSRFRVLGYYTGTESDAETKSAIALCDRFVSGPLTLEEWRTTILADAPHILIYPEIGMDTVSAQLAAQRLAPVQCNSWGHPDTSGFPTLDYYLSSDLMEPPEAQNHYTERLVRLPNLSIYCEPPDGPPASTDRRTLGLRTSATVYCCCQAPSKYIPQYDEVFARIARDVGGCQFAFIEFSGAPHVTDVFRERLERAFAAFDLSAADHCVVLPRQSPDQFIAAIGQCDIFLDSIGWSGCNSTLESLIHNMPIVTFNGALMRGRHTAAILRMMDACETIAQTVDEYVSLAVRLGRDPEFRTAVRAKIAANKNRIYRDRSCIAALEAFLSLAVQQKGSEPTQRSP